MLKILLGEVFLGGHLWTLAWNSLLESKGVANDVVVRFFCVIFGSVSLISPQTFAMMCDKRLLIFASRVTTAVPIVL